MTSARERSRLHGLAASSTMVPLRGLSPRTRAMDTVRSQAIGATSTPIARARRYRDHRRSTAVRSPWTRKGLLNVAALIEKLACIWQEPDRAGSPPECARVWHPGWTKARDMCRFRPTRRWIASAPKEPRLLPGRWHPDVMDDVRFERLPAGQEEVVSAGQLAVQCGFPVWLPIPWPEDAGTPVYFLTSSGLGSSYLVRGAGPDPHPGTLIVIGYAPNPNAHYMEALSPVADMPWECRAREVDGASHVLAMPPGAAVNLTGLLPLARMLAITRTLQAVG
jgi:hypothetical protein